MRALRAREEESFRVRSLSLLCESLCELRFEREKEISQEREKKREKKREEEREKARAREKKRKSTKVSESERARRKREVVRKEDFCAFSHFLFTFVMSPRIAPQNDSEKSKSRTKVS